MKAKLGIVFYVLLLLVACGGADNNTNIPSTSGSSGSSNSSSSSSSGMPQSSDFELTEAQIQKSVFCPSDSDEEGLTPWPAAFSDQEWEGFLSGPLAAEVHGAIPSADTYVFNVGGRYISAYTRDPVLSNTFQTLKRYDQIDVTGAYTPTGSAQPHLNVSQLSHLLKVDSSYQHQFDYSRFDGFDNVKLLGSVHAIAGSGEVLVFNYEDVVLPVFVDEASRETASTLWKFDKVLLDVAIQRIPGRPLHFYTRTGSENAIRLIDPIKDCHGKTVDLEGNLVYLQPNDLYGIQVFDENRVYRSYLVTGDASSLTAVWNQHLDKVSDGKGGKDVIAEFKVRINASVQAIPGAAHLFIPNLNSIEILTE